MTESHERIRGTLMRDPHVGFGRFRVLPRTDGKWIVFDPERELGQGTVDEAPTLALASDACKRASDAATARGEANEPERKGFKNDWGDPATWERMADVPPRPLFPSLLEGKRDGHGTTDNRNDEQRDDAGERRGPRGGLELDLVDEQAQSAARDGRRQSRASKVRARPRSHGERL
jgi:hypothetical protein